MKRNKIIALVLFGSTYAIGINAQDSLLVAAPDSNLMVASDSIPEVEQAPKKEVQPFLVDGIKAVVGGEVILKSDIEVQLQQMIEQGIDIKSKEKCMVWEELLFQKLLLHRADLDSIEVADREVDYEIEKRLRYLLGQMGGSEVEFEKYFGRTVLEFKDEMRPIIMESLKAKRMQANISDNVEISPSEVEAYYKKIPKDSLPVIPEQYKVAQILIVPKVNEYEKVRIKKQLAEIRSEIIAGKDFGLMALLHSQDPGSRNKKGELGFVSREQLVPSFSAAAFNLQVGEISEIVESDYGYHLIQLLEKKGSYINVRHILLTPKIYSTDIELAKERVDSVLKAYKEGKSTFFQLATAVSDDLRTKENGGVLVNYQNGDDYFTAEELEENLYFAIQNLKVGEITQPELIQYLPGKSAYKIVLLVDKVNFHVANITTDYVKIKQAALEQKKITEVNLWIQSKISSTYVRLPEECSKCSNLSEWLKVAQAN